MLRVTMGQASGERQSKHSTNAMSGKVLDEARCPEHVADRHAKRIPNGPDDRIRFKVNVQFGLSLNLEFDA